jgi:hypothetical protein
MQHALPIFFGATILKHNAPANRYHYRDTIYILVGIVREFFKEKSGASSLNFACTDGKTVVCTRFRDHPTEHAPSLYYIRAGSVQMEEKEVNICPARECEKPKAILICSEPIT